MIPISRAFALALPLAALVVAAQAADPVPEAYLGGEWVLVAIGNQPFAARATLDFSEPGRVSGQGPCNRWFAPLESPLPEFRPGPIGATRMACPDLGLEADLFDTLASMTRADVTGGTSLILTGDKGMSMEFTRKAD